MTSSKSGGSDESLQSISTRRQGRESSRVLEFDDGAPSEATAALFAGHLDFLHGIEAFLGVLPGASLAAIRRGFLFVGAEDNSFLLFSELMDSASVFPTGNCDTVYFWGFLDLSDGPMVITCRRSMRPQASSTQSTTCGSGGSPTSVFPARIAARAAGISWWVRATKGRPTSREPFVAGADVRQPNPLNAPNRPTLAASREPVRHHRSQSRRLDRHLLRTHSPRRQAKQLAPNRARQVMVDNPAAL